MKQEQEVKSFLDTPPSKKKKSTANVERAWAGCVGTALPDSGTRPRRKGLLRSVSYSVVLVAMGIGVGIGEGLLSPGKPGIVTIAWSSCLSLTLAVRFYGMSNMMR